MASEVQPQLMNGGSGGGGVTDGPSHETRARRPWIMNAFAMTAPGHLAPGLWRHPDQEKQDLAHWIKVAQKLDAAGFHGLFFADVLGIYDVYKQGLENQIPSNGSTDDETTAPTPGRGNNAPALISGAQIPILDVSLIISALAAATTNLSFGITASTSYETPYSLARRFATLDQLTNGRVGWNIVTTYLESAARSFGFEKLVEHDERYDRADEFLEVFYKLLEGSWEDDAVKADKESGVYADPEKVHRIDHVGKYIKCQGPSLVDPSPQRTPFLLQAGASSAGKTFASKHAECMFLPGLIPSKTRAIVDSMRSLLATHNRPATSIRFLSGIFIVVAPTDAEAQSKFSSLLQYADLEGTAALFGGWTGADLSQFSDDEDFRFSGPAGIQSMISAWTETVPGTKGEKWTKRRVLQELAISGAHPRAVGSPQTVADTLEMWVNEAGVDGFNISYATTPGTWEDLVELLWPELRRRGVLQEGFAGRSMRENYLMDGLGPRVREGHPARDFRDLGRRKKEVERASD